MARQIGQPLAGQEHGVLPGGPFDPGPTRFRNGQFFVVVAPLGNKVAVYDTANGKSQSLRLSDVEGTRQKVTPVFSGGGFVAREPPQACC